MNYAWIPCLLIFFVSCRFKSQNTDIVGIDSFPSQRILTGRGICPKGMLLSRPIECAMIGDTLIVLDDNPVDGYVICLNVVDTSKYYTLFPKGHGPGEWDGLPTFSKQVYNNPKDFLFAKQGFNISLANIDEATASQYEPEEIITLPPKYSTQELYYIDENLVIGTPSDGRGRLFMYNPIEDEINYIPHIPDIPDGAKIRDVEHLYGNFGNFISAKPDNTKIVSALLYFPQIDIFDITGEHLVSIQMPTKERLEPNFSADNYTYYNDITCNNQYIYALYIGERESYANDNFDQLNPEIHVFDWAGQPITKYILDVPVLSFDVNPVKKRIYGINPMSGDNNMVYVFEME